MKYFYSLIPEKVERKVRPVKQKVRVALGLFFLPNCVNSLEMPQMLCRATATREIARYDIKTRSYLSAHSFPEYQVQSDSSFDCF